MISHFNGLLLLKKQFNATKNSYITRYFSYIIYTGRESVV